MVSAGEQVGTKCSIPFTHITGLWLYESHSWCLEHWTPISFEIIDIIIYKRWVNRVGARLGGRPLCAGSERLYWAERPIVPAAVVLGLAKRPEVECDKLTHR